MKNRNIRLLPPGQGASEQGRKPDSETDWQALAEALMSPGRVTERDPPDPHAVELMHWLTADQSLEGFKTTFRELPQSERDRIDARTEEFRDDADFLEREFSSEMRFLLAKDLSASAVYAESIGNLVLAYARDARIRSSPGYARTKLRQIVSYIRFAWGLQVPKHRSLSKEEQHREWSRLMFLGSLPKDLDHRANIGEELVRTSVMRHRKRRERSGIQWALRAAVYRTEHK